MADTTGRGTGRGAATRALILDAALEAFAESGYRGTSVREIAARCGLTHPALIYHFPTKADLLLAVLERRDEDGPLEGLAADRVLARLVETAGANQSRRGLIELFATLSAEATAADHPAHAWFARRYANLVATLTRAYAELAETGELRPGVDPGVAARRLVAVMDGLQVQWLLDPEVDMAAGVAAQITADRG